MVGTYDNTTPEVWMVLFLCLLLFMIESDSYCFALNSLFQWIGLKESFSGSGSCPSYEIFEHIPFIGTVYYGFLIVLY